MIRLPKLALSLGGVVIAAGALTLILPRAAHAVAAALVQVTNTTSNPVITQSPGQQAAHAITVSCDADGPDLVQCASSGSDPNANYAVPNNQYLVITAVDIIPRLSSSLGAPCGASHGILFGGFINNVNVQDSYWLAAANSGSLHFPYPSGIVYPPNSVLRFTSTPPLGCDDNVNLSGYLTPN